MSRQLLGIGAAPGRAMGPARWVRWDLPSPPHRTIESSEVEEEVARFEEARDAARADIERLRARTAKRVGEIEAKIFEPQVLMLEDPDLVDGTVSYIRDNFLAAERAFDWRILEIRSRFLDTAHAMVVDRLADLQDIRYRVLSRLLDREVAAGPREEEGAVLLFRELTPSLAVDLDASRVAGLLTVTGSRMSHSAVLARSLRVPTVVGVGSVLEEVEDGSPIILDGGSGRIVVDPSPSEVASFRAMADRVSEWTRRMEELAARPTETADGERVRLQANLDQPDEAEAAARVGADGVGLFRSEFLVIGRRVIPDEEEQYRAYARVVQAFSGRTVTLRTFDIGGDKFPIFLQMPPEANPYLGWRAIRVCLDLPDLFRNQLRAAARAAVAGKLRLLVPLVVSVDEVRRTRELLRQVLDDLGAEGPADIPLGIMVETPAAAETLDILAPHVDFLSLGTNDLTQYVMAADRGNPRLAELHDPLHPALLRLYVRVREASERHGLPVGVCGDVATDPVGLAVLLGLGYREFSLPPSSIAELREIVRSVSAEELARLCSGLGDAESAGEVRAPVAVYLEGAVPFETAAALRLSAV